MALFKKRNVISRTRFSSHGWIEPTWKNRYCTWHFLQLYHTTDTYSICHFLQITILKTGTVSIILYLSIWFLFIKCMALCFFLYDFVILCHKSTYLSFLSLHGNVNHSTMKLWHIHRLAITKATYTILVEGVVTEYYLNACFPFNVLSHFRSSIEEKVLKITSSLLLLVKCWEICQIFLMYSMMYILHTKCEILEHGCVCIYQGQ